MFTLKNLVTTGISLSLNWKQYIKMNCDFWNRPRIYVCFLLFSYIVHKSKGSSDCHSILIVLVHDLRKLCCYPRCNRTLLSHSLAFFTILKWFLGHIKPRSHLAVLWSRPMPTCSFPTTADLTWVGRRRDHSRPPDDNSRLFNVLLPT